ncbi:MAG: hypothetical protein ACJA1I_000708 [Zhongshania marina]|jgi:hypothetical protein
MSDPFDSDSETSLKCRIHIDLIVRKKAQLIPVLVVLVLALWGGEIWELFGSWLPIRG